jgi:hypothetical protein
VLNSPSTQALFLHENNVIYLAMPLRNAGTGIAHLQGYRLDPEPADRGRHRLLASRSARPDELDLHRNAGPRHQRLTVDLLYGDLEDGQPTITRFVLLPSPTDTWRCDVTHHWRNATDGRRESLSLKHRPDRTPTGWPDAASKAQHRQ